MTNAPAQISFSLGNPGAPNTVYISSDPTKNALTLQITVNAAVALTPAQPVPQAQAGSASGSLLYLDLSALGIDAADFGKFALACEGWTSKPFPADGQICFSPTSATSLADGQPVSFDLTGFVLPQAPATPSVALKLDTYHAPPVAKGGFPAISNSQVVATPPPGGQSDLHQSLSAALLPEAIAVSQTGTPEVSNSLTLTLSQIGGGATAQAGPDTVFTLTVIYASDQNGYGALMTPDEGRNISIPPPPGSGWTPTNIDGLEGRSWQLVPTSGTTLPVAGGGPVSFDLSPIVTYFQPGPTVLLLSYKKVPGFADGAFALTLIKEPHVHIASFTADPTLTPLGDNQQVSVELTWSVSHFGLLMLDPMHVDVTKMPSFKATIQKTTSFTLTAYGSGSGDVDNVDIKNAMTTVVPVLNSFTASPAAISVDDFSSGSPSVFLTWSVNAPRSSQLQLTSSVTGPYSTKFGGLGTTSVDVTEPQMFTLNVVGDTRPEDLWRLYVPAFTLQKNEPAAAGGAYVVAAPGASYVAVAQASANQLAILSTASYSQIATVGCGTSPTGLAFSSDGSTIYVASLDGVTAVSVTALSQQTPPWSFSAGTPIALGGGAVQVALAPADYVYATVGSSTGPGQLAQISLADNSVNNVTVGNGPFGLAVTPSGAQVFVANRADGTVSQVGIAPDGTPQLIRTLANLPGCVGVAVTPDGNTLLVACNDGTVQLLDATAPDTSPRTPIKVGGTPYQIALDPSGAYAYVTDNAGGRVALINIANAAVVGTPVSVAANPQGISVSPDGMLVLVGHQSSISVLSLQTYELRSNPPNCGGYVTDIQVSADGRSAFVWADASVKYKGLTPASGLHVYDTPSETLRPALAGTPIIQLAVASAASNAGFLTQMGQSALYPFDTQKLTLGSPLAIPAKGAFTSRQPMAVATADDASRVFVLVSDGSDQFSIVVFTDGKDGYTLTDDVTAYTAIGMPIAPKLAAAPDGGAAFAYDGTNGNLWSITATDGPFTLGTALALGVPAVSGILVSVDGSTLYLAGQQQMANAFFIVDCAGWTFDRRALTEPATSLSIRAMALSPDGTRILISDPTGGTIRFIDTESIRFLQTIVDPGTFKAPEGVRMSPDQSRLFVADQSGLIATAIQVRPSASKE